MRLGAWLFTQNIACQGVMVAKLSREGRALSNINKANILQSNQTHPGDSRVSQSAAELTTVGTHVIICRLWLGTTYYEDIGGLKTTYPELVGGSMPTMC